MPEPSTDPDAALAEFVGAPLPAGYLALDLSDRAAFAALVLDARRRQTATLEQAFNDTMRYVPFPVRKIVQKVLLG